MHQYAHENRRAGASSCTKGRHGKGAGVRLFPPAGQVSSTSVNNRGDGDS